MFCPKCGAKVIDDAEFCQKCGAKLIVDAPADQPTVATQSTPVQQPNYTSSPANTQGKKKSKVPIIIGAVVAVALILVILAAIGGSEPKKTSPIASANTSGVDLSETYTNNEEGFSFQYPSAWIPFEKDEIEKYTNARDVGDPLVFLANEPEDLPEGDSYIIVTKLNASQDEIELFFADDEQFIESFDNDEVTIKDTSMTQIGNVPARKATYLTSDGTGYQSYYYAANSAIYRIDFVWMGNDPGNLQRFFDAVIDSYTITANSTTTSTDSTQTDTNQVLLCGISVQDVFGMTEDEIIETLGTPDTYIGPDCFKYGEDDSWEYVSFWINSSGYVDSIAATPDKFSYNGHTFDVRSCTNRGKSSIISA